jgi:hypothetical protein
VSYREWVSSNGMGRLRIYSDDMLCRFDKLSGSMAFREDNVMIEYEDYQSNQRMTIIAERCVVYEEGNHVYIQLMGRRVVQMEPLSARRRATRIPRVRRPIEIHNEF